MVIPRWLAHILLEVLDYTYIDELFFYDRPHLVGYSYYFKFGTNEIVVFGKRFWAKLE